MLASCSQTSGQDLTQTPVDDPAAEADAHLAEGDLASAAEVWQNVLASQPEDLAANYQLGLILAVSDPGEAGQYLAKAAELDAGYTVSADRMQSALRQALVVDDLAYQLTLVGQALASLEEWSLAEAALRQAVADAPNYPEAWAYLGEVLQQTGKDGYPALQTAIQLDPASYAANVFMGLYWRRSQQPNEALRYLQTAASQDPENLTLLQDLTYTLVQAGMVDEALEKVYQAVEADAENGQAWLLLAKISVEHEIQVAETGIPAARQAVVLIPDGAEPLLVLGRAYILVGNTPLAERFISEANLADPAWAAPHYYLGLLYFNLGELEASKGHLLKALALAEEHSDSFIQEQAFVLLEQFSQ